MKFLFSILALGFFWTSAASQTTGPQPTPDPGEAARRIREYNRNSAMMETLRSDKPPIRDRSRMRRILNDRFDALYRIPDQDELGPLLPSPVTAKRYRDLLAQKNTGIIRLIPSSLCASSANVVTINDRCSQYSVPGSGSAFSFRTESYRLPVLSDIAFTGSEFIAPGDLTQGIFTDLGAVAIEDVRADSPYVIELDRFRPVATVDAAIAFAKELESGVNRSGYLFRRSVPVRPGSTYLLRSIAYSGPNYKAFENVTYDEFMFDRRRDIKVAFSVLAREPDGSIVLVWKRLSEAKAPKRLSNKP